MRYELICRGWIYDDSIEGCGKIADCDDESLALDHHIGSEEDGEHNCKWFVIRDKVSKLEKLIGCGGGRIHFRSNWD